GLRFPGLISYETEPGGGTTDYAVEIFYEAIKHKKYTCYLKQGTSLDMMYMPDAIRAMIELMEANPIRLKHRNAYNITAMNFTPEIIASEIKKSIPGFEISYQVDPARQAIADSWPDYMDDSSAREEWGWKPSYTLAAMTTDMLTKLGGKINRATKTNSKKSKSPKITKIARGG
ncbi:MAG TPA: L-threonine 3-dehydrogenase, partial [candidate division Zixibacteria bacterium]|nr:L-threonine 3-dehydrogenase [candidate division Zixibacteria bacterium]